MDKVLDNRWFTLTLAQQMVNIGNEVKRAMRFNDRDDKRDMFLDKAIKYIHLSMLDPKNAKVIPELSIGEKVLSDYMGENSLNCSREQILRYYESFNRLL